MWEWLAIRYSPEALVSAWGAVLLGYAGFMALERIIPANRNPGARELAADGRANLVFILLNPLAVFAGAMLSAPAARALGGPRLELDLSIFGAHSAGSFLLAFAPLLLFDFFYYWFHRMQHRWPWLWEQHKLHHAEAALNVTTNFRHHWLEEFFRTFFILLPMNWLVAVEPAASAAAAILIRQWSNFFHANIRLPLGPLTPVVTGPQYHRIHHSVETRHIGKNYAAFFPLWDWIFGTYWRPEKGEWPETGLEDTDGVWSFRELLFAPFIGWGRALQGRLGDGTSRTNPVTESSAPPPDAT